MISVYFLKKNEPMEKKLGLDNWEAERTKIKWN